VVSTFREDVRKKDQNSGKESGQSPLKRWKRKLPPDFPSYEEGQKLDKRALVSTRDGNGTWNSSLQPGGL
jgi:hypothetical protein